MDHQLRHERIDVSGILDDIRKDLAKETLEEIPSFSSIPIPLQSEHDFLPDEIEDILGDTSIQSNYPVNSRNPILRALKSWASKLARPAVFPVTQRLTSTNFALKVAIIRLADELELHKNEMRELNARLELVEKLLEQAKKDQKMQ